MKRIVAVFVRIPSAQIKPVEFGTSLNPVDKQLQFMSGTGITGKLKCHYDQGYLPMVF